MSSPDIFLCSDIHFGAEDRTLISAFLADVDASTADRRVVVIPGDLVQRGRKAEFAKAHAFLRALRSRGVAVVLTPGNHDLGCWAHEHLPRPFNPGKVRSRFQKLWKAHLLDARQRDHTLVAARDMDAIHRVGDHVFVALRSVHRGRWGRSSKRISSDQIKWARKTLRKKGLSHLTLHLVTHRSLWGGRHSAMRRRGRLGKKLLARLRFATLIHGHNHEFLSLEERSLPKVGRTIHHLSVPSLTSKRDGSSGWVRWTQGDSPECTPWT